MNDYPDGPSLSERSGYAQLGTTFGGDADAVRPRNMNPDCNRELRECAHLNAWCWRFERAGFTHTAAAIAQMLRNELGH